MHYLLRLILENIIENIITNIQFSDLAHISINSLIAIVILLIISLIIFLIFRGIFLRLIYGKDIPSSQYEYRLMRRHFWAWIYVFNCFWLSGEIFACWHYNWIVGYLKYIPLWIVFIFCAIMAIINAYPLKKKSTELNLLYQKVNVEKIKAQRRV